jgi:aminoglycoside phosphotransferase (APT) family kinase protein
MDLTSLEPLAGGWSGETFLADVAGERTVVRIYARPGPRGASAHEVDASLLRLVRGLVPVPRVLEARRADPAGDLPALLITTWVEGERGDLLVPRLDAAGRRELGSRLGDLLADLAGMPMLTAGPFVDGDLRIGSFTGPDERPLDGLPAFLELLEPSLGWWRPDELAGLRELVVDAQALLDTVDRCCLVHSDFNPKNLLVDPDTLQVTALLDWEYAHAGHPFTDLGNLLRFEREPGFSSAVLGAYVARRGGTADEALTLARAADLWALLDLASRRSENPVAQAADRLLREVARTRDLQAAPGV